MSNQNENLVEGLKHLLSIANDGKEGYKNAAENADAGELKALFTTYSIQRSEFADVLKTCIQQNGGDPDNTGGGPLGVLHRTWIDIKTALTGNDNKAVLDAVITGEKAAVEAYDKVLQDVNIQPELMQILSTQRDEIREAMEHIQRLEHQHS
ncbi:ferritin-like domain-containing protein [Rubrolithibacter danxiaensis]|uniref:ferritin-like domain-containing protein n=1 Tax=Rubrolithibacter danxiaensis TaxID=3390805 RepID=UPI003BF869F5